MRSVSSPANNVEVEVRKNVTRTKVGKLTISHGQYFCKVDRVTPLGLTAYFGPRKLEYAVAAIVSEAKKSGRKIVFYQSLDSVMLKKRIKNVSMIEIVVGRETVWAVVENKPD